MMLPSGLLYVGCFTGGKLTGSRSVCMNVLGIDCKHPPLSVFAYFDELFKISPVVKVPALITDDNELLNDFRR